MIFHRFVKSCLAWKSDDIAEQREAVWVPLAVWRLRGQGRLLDWARLVAWLRKGKGRIRVAFGDGVSLPVGFRWGAFWG